MIAVEEDEVFVVIHRDGSAPEVQGITRRGEEAMTARKVKETVTLKDGTVLDDEAEVIARERGVKVSALKCPRFDTASL